MPASPTCAACGAQVLETDSTCARCGTTTGTGTRESALVPTTAGVTRTTLHAEFRGTERFRLERKLGSGGMGIVFAAFDRQRGEMVALKTLFNRNPIAISRLKHEFRSLADVTHPNLVGLFELVADRGDWFYTMELIDGVDLLRAVRRRGLDVNRLRHVLGQVAEGVIAIHDAGKLHRDLKPSNVMVTGQNRAVLLDFGIVAELQTQGPQMDAGDGLVGTLGYMAPEQIEGHAEPSSDWYAVGVMLYQALTGRLPYTGDPYRVMSDKREKDPAAPDALVPDLPADLVALCTALMARDPSARPRAADVLARLGRRARPAWATGASAIPAAAVVGRERQVQALLESLNGVAPDRAVLVCLHGSSGTGKSALMQWFLRNRVPTNAVVLQGRCYVRESVPYKALDGVIESLNWHLRSLLPPEIDALLPSGIGALARLFPVLDGLTDGDGTRVAADMDPIQVRRRAFDALRELVQKIAHARPVVIAIDDLQWSDAESALAIDELLGQSGQPGALVIASFRSEDIATQPFLQSLIDRTRRAEGHLAVHEVELGPLAEEETRALVAALVSGAQGPRPSAGEIDEIVREARGIPFLAELLSRHASRAAGSGAARVITIEDTIAAELRDLPDGCPAFLEVVTVAGRPVDTIVAREAARVEGDERRLVGALQGAHLLRPSGSAALVEPYHDRIRETVIQSLSAARLAAIHLGLARAMEARAIDEPETLAEHYLEAGYRDIAATYSGRAARAAGLKLAFERAASLFARALQLSPDDADRASWEIGRADAMANAGRGIEAARAYLEAARTPSVDAEDMKRRAADHLLRCGRITEGLAVIDGIAESVGLGVRRSRLHTIARVLARQAWFRVRGIRVTDQGHDHADPSLLKRIDMCITLAGGLARVDGIRAADYQSLAVRLAAGAGEPVRAAHAVLGYAGFRCLGGSRAAREIGPLVEQAAGLASRAQHPHVTGVLHLVRCMVHSHAGRFADARPEVERAEAILRQQCVDVWRHIDLSHAYTMLGLYYLGDLNELGRRVPQRLREARDHDDSYAAADAMGRPNILWLARGDVTSARDALAEIRQPDAAHQLDWPDWLRLFAETQVDLYAGNAVQAWTRAETAWPRLGRTTVMWVQSTRIEAIHLRARAALAAASVRDDRRHLTVARKASRRLRRENATWATAFADLVDAAVADRVGDRAALECLGRARAAFEASSLSLFAMAARRRYGTRLGGSDGADHVAGADAWMASQGIVDPERMTQLLAPGFRA